MTKTIKINVEGQEHNLTMEYDPTKDEATLANELIEAINEKMGHLVKAQRVEKTHRVLNFKTKKDGDTGISPEKELEAY